MPTPAQSRLQAARQHPRILDLWWAMRPLTSVVRLMNTGAHPDDETTSMLAALALRDGVNLSYACSTRGEGGQNDIGTESGPALGALRTREMERACDLLNMRMYWHSTAPEDSITDFRFSKSGTETLGIWGHTRLMKRFVDIVRTDRPDIILPTFLDVPGQHGHHRAMTQAAFEVIKAAADPDFASDLPAWQVSKLYLPAWSGAGQAYDDDLPPPPATLIVEGAGHEPISGWSFARIGQMSRAFHRTQGMGRWIPAGPGQDWPLHLAVSHVAGPDITLGSGLPYTLSDLGVSVPVLRRDLEATQTAINSAIAAFPAFEDVARHAATALFHVQSAIAACPPEADILHRLQDKETQLGHVVRLAHGIEATAETSHTWVRPGDETALTCAWDPGTADASYALDLPTGWETPTPQSLHISNAAHGSDPYRARYDPADPPAPRLMIRLHGTHVAIPFQAPPVVLPACAATVTPGGAVINVQQPGRQIAVTLSHMHPISAVPTLDLPDGWHAQQTDTGLIVTVPDTVEPGLFTLPLSLDGAPAMSEIRIAHDHTDPTAFAHPAELQVRVLDVAVPQARTGYIGSGHDAVAHWLTAMGAQVTSLGDDMLASDAALAEFDTLVIGIFALRFRDSLAGAMPRLHTWVANGGTLLTLYHRPWDNWTPDQTPPKRLEIGQPSLRWRVTDAKADVTHLDIDHPLLSTPNAITQADWQNWVKERGLYFAKSWDTAYTPLLSMSDPGEDPLQGALLTAEIGAGRHTHCALILHHQMAHLVPGAFRLMANLITPRT